MKQLKVKLKPAQVKQIEMLLKNAKFNRLTNGLLKDKTISVDQKSKLILDLKRKLFGR